MGTEPILTIKNHESQHHHQHSNMESDSSSSGDDGLFLQFDSDDSGQASNTTKSTMKSSLGTKPMITELKSVEFSETQRMKTKNKNVNRR